MGYYRTICFLSSLIGLTLFTLQVTGQTDQSKQIDISLKSISSGRADTNRVRAQLTLSNLYLNRTLDPKSALRKALVLAGQAQELSERLEFVKGVDEAVFLAGKINIRQHNIAGALARLARLSDTNRIRLLLELGKDKLRPTYTRKANRDSAIFFFRQAEALSQGVFLQKWQEEGRVLIGVAYVLSKDWPRGKAMFMQVIEARRRAGDMAGEMKLWLRMATTTFCDDCRENMNCLENALAIARRTGNRSYEALILMEMGYEYFQLDKGKTRQPERKAMDALAIQKVIGFQALNRAHHELAGQSVYTTAGEYGYLSNANYFMSDLSQAKGDLNQKLFYVLEVVKSMESSGMSDDLDYAYLKLGNAYYELGQFDKSMEYHQKSLAVSHQKGQLFIQMGLASRMVVALLKQGKPPRGVAYVAEHCGDRPSLQLRGQNTDKSKLWRLLQCLETIPAGGEVLPGEHHME
jgi:tetratricopeptide (TPR) repeat protein